VLINITESKFIFSMNKEEFGKTCRNIDL